jgi:hypothetical protein
LAGNVSGADRTPWVDSGAPAGPNLWYRVTAVNAGGVDGAPSAVFQMKDLTIDDNAANFSLTYSHTTGVAIDTRTPALYNGDAARMAFWAAEPYQQIAWQAAGPVQAIEAITYDGSPSDSFQFQVSTDGVNWTEVPLTDMQIQDQTVGANNDMAQFIYTIDGVQQLLPGARYVAVAQSANMAGTAELGEMRITYAPAS